MGSTIRHRLHWIISVRPAFMWTWKNVKTLCVCKDGWTKWTINAFISACEMDGNGTLLFFLKFLFLNKVHVSIFFGKQRFPPKTHRLWHTNARTCASNTLMYWKIWCGCTWSVQILRGHIFPKARLNTCTSETCARFNSLNAMQWYGKLKTVFQYISSEICTNNLKHLIWISW